jgi:hypothetical protein
MDALPWLHVLESQQEITALSTRHRQTASKKIETGFSRHVIFQNLTGRAKHSIPLQAFASLEVTPLAQDEAINLEPEYCWIKIEHDASW